MMRPFHVSAQVNQSIELQEWGTQQVVDMAWLAIKPENNSIKSYTYEANNDQNHIKYYREFEGNNKFGTYPQSMDRLHLLRGH